MELTPEFITEILQSYVERVAIIEAVGGVSMESVQDNRATVPAGWHLDWETDYFIPPNLHLHTFNQKAKK